MKEQYIDRKALIHAVEHKIRALDEVEKQQIIDELLSVLCCREYKQTAVKKS